MTELNHLSPLLVQALRDLVEAKRECASYREVLTAALGQLHELNELLDDERRRSRRLTIRRREERIDRVKRRQTACALEERSVA